MRRVIEYILEGIRAEKHKPTKEWMEKSYKKFNKLYFNNELPECELDVSKDMAQATFLGQFGFDTTWYFNRNKPMADGYEMFVYEYKEYSAHEGRMAKVSVKDLLSIAELRPHIRLNPRYEFTWNEMEDTLIHEMIHFWTYKDGIAPKQAHGKVFRRKCDEIREMAKANGKNYNLRIYAQNNGNWELNDEEKQKMIAKQEKKNERSTLLYFEHDPNKISGRCYMYTKRFGIYLTKNIKSIVEDIKRYDNNSVTIIYELSNSCINKLAEQFGTFKVCRTYRFWDATSGKYAAALKKIVAEDKNKKILYKA